MYVKCYTHCNQNFKIIISLWVELHDKWESDIIKFIYLGAGELTLVIRADITRFHELSSQPPLDDISRNLNLD